MKKYLLLSLIFTILIFSSISAFAYEPFSVLGSVRGLAMGKTSVAAPDEDDLLYTNPAFLGELKKSHLNIINLTGGIGPDAINQLNKINDAMGQSNTQNQAQVLSQIIPSLISSQVGLSPLTLSMLNPGFGVGAYSKFKLSTEILNKQSPRFDITAVGDASLILGKSMKLSPNLTMGGAVRYNYRVASYDPTTQSNKISLGYTDLFNIIQNTGNSTYSYYAVSGLSLDLGLLLKAPQKQRFAVTIKNLFNSLSGEQITRSSTTDSSSQLSTQAYNTKLPVIVTLGYAAPATTISPINPLGLLSNTTVTCDWRIVSPEKNFYRNIFAGVEKKILKGLLDLRAGLRDGYLNYGFGINLGLIDIDYAYTVEEASDILGLKALDTHLISVGISF